MGGVWGVSGEFATIFFSSPCTMILSTRWTLMMSYFSAVAHASSTVEAPYLPARRRSFWPCLRLAQGKVPESSLIVKAPIFSPLALAAAIRRLGSRMA